MNALRRTLLGVGLCAAAIAAALFLPGWALFLLTISLSKALIVLGLLLLMRTGLVSFGQGLYSAVGAYAAGLAANRFGVVDAVPMVLAGTLVAAAVAAILGLLLARYRGIFFAMLSLALSMILYGLLVRTSALGSTDGFNLAAKAVFSLSTGAGPGRHGVFFVTVLAGMGAALALDRYLRSRLGRLTPAVRDNELRVEYMGASVRNLVHLHLIIAGALAGAGGALTALAVGHIDPEMAYWTTSGEFVFIAILSGTGSVAAPFLGAVLLELLRSFAYERAPNTWQLVVGAAMLAVILFLPEGVWSLFRRRRRVAP